MDRRPATSRLFLALWPGPAVRDALLAWRDAWDWPPGAALVAADKLHLTLHFLGSQPRARVPGLAAGLAVPFKPFRIELGAPAVWPGGVAVLEPQTPPEALLQLHADLASALLALGVAPETRQYRPHVTLSRRARQARAPVARRPVAWDVAGYALVLSSGASYEVLRHYP